MLKYNKSGWDSTDAGNNGNIRFEGPFYGS